jgi:hypothetical protein
MTKIAARVRRFFWLLNPINMFRGWCAYDVYNYLGKCVIIGAIIKHTPPRKGEPDTLKVFWEMNP